MPTKRTKARTSASLSLFPLEGDPEVMYVHTAARMLGISIRMVYSLLKNCELDGLKLDGRWLINKDSGLLRLKLKGSEEDMLARAIANGDEQTHTAARKSGKVQVKKRK